MRSLRLFFTSSISQCPAFPCLFSSLSNLTQRIVPTLLGEKVGDLYNHGKMGLLTERKNIRYLDLNWSRSMHLRGIGYAFAASLMFGLGVVLAKLVSSEIDAPVAAFLSLAVGGLLLAGFLALTGISLLCVLPILTR